MTESDLQRNLSKFGFQRQENNENFLQYHKNGDSNASPFVPIVAKTTAPKMPWQISEWAIECVESSIKTTNLSFNLSLNQLLRNINFYAIEKFGNGTKIEAVEAKNDAIWILFEFGPPTKIAENDGERPERANVPPSLGGFKFIVSVENNDFTINHFDFFGIGYLPQNFCIGACQVLYNSLFFNLLPTSSVGIFEHRFALSQFISYFVDDQVDQEALSILKSSLAMIDTFSVFGEFHSKNHWEFNISHSPIGDGFLASPSLEMLEERELIGDGVFVPDGLQTNHRSCPNRSDRGAHSNNSTSMRYRRSFKKRR